MRQLLYFLPLLLFLVPAVPQDPGCINNDPCKGQPNCTGCTDLVHVPDPENCRGYYICTDGSPGNLPWECDEGEVFNATSHQCEEGTECEECGGSSSGSCAYECTKSETGFISSTTDCSSYYECEGTEVTGSFTCEDDTPFFNGEVCQTDEAACCHCRPYCYEGEDGTDFNIPDPVDCRKYHTCLETDEGFPTITGTCPDGQNFDSVIKGCTATASCNPACRNVVGPDGCIAPFTCLTEGYFAACPGKCETDYYHCSAATGEYQDAESCLSGTVFHPDSHTCVDPEKCP